MHVSIQECMTALELIRCSHFVVDQCNCCRDFGPGTPGFPPFVKVVATRAMPATPSLYHTTIFGNAQGADNDRGPLGQYTDEFTCPACIVTVPHVEIACIMPAGYGGQLGWIMEVLDQRSTPIRYVIDLTTQAVHAQ